MLQTSEVQENRLTKNAILQRFILLNVLYGMYFPEQFDFVGLQKLFFPKSFFEHCQKTNVFKHYQFRNSFLTYFQNGPGVAEMLTILGKETSLSRIEAAVRKISP